MPEFFTAFGCDANSPMILIVGGGLAGLICAKVLHENGVEFQLIEAAESVGGRLKTTVTPDGFRLDHGFQVLLDSYPAVRRHIDIENLQPGFFDSGAILMNGTARSIVRHPLQHPSGIWESTFGKYATWQDKFLLGKLVAELLVVSPEKLLNQDRLRLSTMEFLAKRDFSPFIIESFFRPFFGGILLDNELSTSAALFQYYLQKFIVGRTLIPAGGIREIPLQLASKLPPSHIRLHSPATRLENRTVHLASGEKLSGEHIVIATSAPVAARLLGRKPPPPPRQVAVCYFESNEPIYPEKLLILPAGKKRLVRHFAQVSNVSPTLAPAGRHLLSATVLERGALDDAALFQSSQNEISEMFPNTARLLRPLQVIDVPYAVPAQPPRFSLQRTITATPPHIWIAGDHTIHGSIQGAMESGERAAHSILRA